MNINTKAIIASTLLTALFAGTSAIAGDNDHFAAADYETAITSVVMQKVSYQAPSVSTNDDSVLSGKK